MTHRFTDAFTIVAPTKAADEFSLAAKRSRLEWANGQNWLLLDEATNTLECGFDIARGPEDTSRMSAQLTLPPRPEFLARFRFTEAEFESTGFKWSDLESVFTSHQQGTSRLQAAASALAETLRRVPTVHSIKIRVKDPHRLVAKLIRKKIQFSKRKFAPADYETEVTDLIGIRALHLFKDGWQPIDEFVRSEWDTKEKPKAYVREGDPHVGNFDRKKFNVVKHEYGYRSLHYLLEARLTKKPCVAELQVRTLIEEAWSEIDHLVRYPDDKPDPQLNAFLSLFNRLAGSADEMGTFIKHLQRATEEQRAKVAEFAAKLSEKDDALSRTLDELKLKENDRKRLEKEIAGLRASSVAAAGITLTPASSGIRLFGGTEINPYSFGVLGAVTKRQCTLCFKEFEPKPHSLGFTCPECERGGTAWGKIGG